MRKNRAVFLILALCLGLSACGSSGEAETTTEAAVETVIMEAPTEAPTEPMTEPTEAPTEAVTVPTTQPPREIGPEVREGSAVTIANVSVAYADALPQSIKSSSTYSVSGFKEEFVLNESQTYAVISFTVTNQTAGEIKIADIHDDFLIELIYDNQYVYSPDSDSWCFFQSGAQTAVVSDMASIGSVTLAPLATKGVTVYIPCAKEVSTDVEKYLIVVFTSNYSGYENFEFVIR